METRKVRKITMVMDGEIREGDGGAGEGEVVEEQNDVIEGIMSAIESVARLGDYRRTQRKESYGLVRRMKLLLPLIEEIRDLDTPMSETSISCFRNLKKPLLMAKKLLKACNEGSKIHLALEMESFMIKFHAVYDKLSQALDGLAYDELGISDEVREQVELVCVQLRRAKRRTDTQDIELAMDMMAVFSKKEERNADSAILERLAKKLDLHSVEDLENETIAIRKLLKERGAQSLENTQQVIDLLNKFKQAAGMEITNVLEDPVRPRALEKCQSLVIPHEFLCPITLEIMTDPVIVASGQTYERQSIEKWFDSNHRTCPKTRQTLAHLSVAPNYALKNLILQWCEKNNFKLPKKNNPAASSEGSKTEHIEAIMALVEKLSSSALEVQRATAKKIRMLSRENPENRILIAKCGGISPLVPLLSYPDSKIQEHAVTALLNLSIDETNKKLIASEEAIPPIIEILQNGSIEARENSAAALFSLSMLDENKIAIGSSNGIAPLVDLLQNGTIRGKKDAVTALFNLSLNHVNKAIAIDAGIILPLLDVLEDKNLGMVDEALSIFLLLASHPQGRHKIGQLSFIRTLVEFIGEGTPKNKECALAVLLELGSNNSSFILAALQYGVYEHLTELMKSGTNRAQRKASALLHLISKSEHL